MLGTLASLGLMVGVMGVDGPGAWVLLGAGTVAGATLPVFGGVAGWRVATRNQRVRVSMAAGRGGGLAMLRVPLK